jgi:hypothetical protein
MAICDQREAIEAVAGAKGAGAADGEAAVIEFRKSNARKTPIYGA